LVIISIQGRIAIHAWFTRHEEHPEANISYKYSSLSSSSWIIKIQGWKHFSNWVQHQ